MDIILPCVCGVDVHEKMIEACILKKQDNEIIIIRQQFSTFPEQLSAFVKWLYEKDCYHIAMESTGVYWRPIYETIEREAFYYENITVGNAHHMKNVPGRKSDVKDAEWIATLLLHGLIQNSFVPNKTIRSLREATRTYKKFVGENSRYKNRIEKFLQTHGFKLSSVLKDIFCVTGRNILNHLAQRGSLTIEDISLCKRGNLKASTEDIFAAINIPLTEIDCRILRTLLERLQTSEKDLENIIQLMNDIAEPYSRQLEIIDSIPGIDRLAALLILAEIGNEPQNNFQTYGRLCSWAGLVPRNDESAGKIYSKKVLPGNQYLKPILNQVAWVAVKQRGTPFHHWFGSRQKKLGQKTAITAVARKILKLIFTLISSDSLYNKNIAMSNIEQ